MFKKILAKFKKKGRESVEQTTSDQRQPNTTDKMNTLLNELKNIFAEELLIDPRIRDFEITTYGNSCRQRCNNIMETTTRSIEKIKNHIEQNEDLHKERGNFTKFTDKVIANLQESSGKLNTILSGSESAEGKERQLKCYNLGMTVQQSTRAIIDAYISTFNNVNS